MMMMVLLILLMIRLIVQSRRDVGGGGPARAGEYNTEQTARQPGVTAVLGKLASWLHTCSSQLAS